MGRTLHGPPFHPPRTHIMILERPWCYRCGSTAIVSICHHCGQPMCAEHSPPTIDLAGRPLSHEFAGLGLERLAPYHCDACRHAVRGRLWALTIVGGLASVVGV